MVNLHVQISWQAQHFVNLHAPLEALAVALSALSAVVTAGRRWSAAQTEITHTETTHTETTHTETTPKRLSAMRRYYDAQFVWLLLHVILMTTPRFTHTTCFRLRDEKELGYRV